MSRLPWYENEASSMPDTNMIVKVANLRSIIASHDLDEMARVPGAYLLHESLQHDRKFFAKAILSVPGLDINERTGHTDQTPLDCALETGDRELIEAVLKYPGVIVPPEIEVKLKGRAIAGLAQTQKKGVLPKEATELIGSYISGSKGHLGKQRSNLRKALGLPPNAANRAAAAAPVALGGAGAAAASPDSRRQMGGKKRQRYTRRQRK